MTESFSDQNQPTDPNILGNFFRSARIAMELPQRVLAERIGTTHDQISRIETGKSNPTWEYALKFAAVLSPEEVEQMVILVKNSPHHRRQDLYRALNGATSTFRGLLNMDDFNEELPPTVISQMKEFLSEWDSYLDNFSKRRTFT
jgi:transcriptional regulator with XRE-family HTH domain